MSVLVFAQQKSPSISWDKTSHNFETIKQEDGLVKYRFIFENTGNEPLVLLKVKAECGCTTVDYNKEPIAPGAKGFVEVSYDPKNHSGIFDKKITVLTNGTLQPASILRITGEVVYGSK